MSATEQKMNAGATQRDTSVLTGSSINADYGAAGAAIPTHLAQQQTRSPH
jgi:hypothetical protein